ncbi:uncharacterized protein BO66DRAFT_390388 [Aspergillus aculeatinus CBS 121060]|uniref:Uncharacterized protein n=1 Tax=Aspergillus aculeatinus CBS 121060 TaxID=1448322 RepID=A0ACD1HES1_9EURO|nr:hypothetical protein BO66DRAFT_390388 [Aspergillus aculeatinus CBS 121060]RAH71876.1 hypothetical protein BO66DRAFT_390388 [Aspergillus aculeatinus CBS 121060]
MTFLIGASVTATAKSFQISVVGRTIPGLGISAIPAAGDTTNMHVLVSRPCPRLAYRPEECGIGESDSHWN